MKRHRLKRTMSKRQHQGSPRFRKSERGQGLVEYALGLVLVSLVATVSLALMGTSIKDVYCTAVQTLDATAACTSGAFAPTILNTHYDPDEDELRITAKADDECPDDLQVKWGSSIYTMDRQGSSYVFKTTIESPPSSVKVGHDNCGWSTVKVNK